MKGLGYYLYDTSHLSLAIVLGFRGNTLPITTVTSAPSGAPPGGTGVQFQVVAGVITVWVWDPINQVWISK
jgi:hypothetical protein